MWPHRALGPSIKGCAAPGSASWSLASLSSRNEVSLSPLHPSLWAELLSWRLPGLILGLPQLGPETELLEAVSLSMLVAGESWEEGALFQQKGINGAQPQGDVPSSICTCHAVTKCPRPSRDISNTAMSVLEKGWDQSLHRGLKATVLAAIAEVGRPSRAVPLGGHEEGGGSCRHRVCFEEQPCPWRELRDRETD